MAAAVRGASAGGVERRAAPGVPQTVTDEHVERVIVKALEETPAHATRRSTRSMARATGMSQSTVSRVWRACGPKSHLTESFKLSPDPQFVEKARDIVGLYLNPPEGALVLCVEEKAQIQALDRTAPILPMRPGLPSERPTTTAGTERPNLYAALDVASGRVISGLTDRHRAIEFRGFLNRINRSVPADLDAPLHTHLQLLSERRRALVRRAHPHVARPRHPPLDHGTRAVHPRLDSKPERKPKPIRVAHDRRRDPRHPRRISRADL
jgi:hypothetical protein